MCVFFLCGCGCACACKQELVLTAGPVRSLKGFTISSTVQTSIRIAK